MMWLWYRSGEWVAQMPQAAAAAPARGQNSHRRRTAPLRSSKLHLERCSAQERADWVQSRARCGRKELGRNKLMVKLIETWSPVAMWPPLKARGSAPSAGRSVLCLWGAVGWREALVRDAQGRRAWVRGAPWWRRCKSLDISNDDDTQLEFMGVMHDCVIHDSSAPHLSCPPVTFSTGVTFSQ
jgi:hypothetical protein